MPRGSSKRGTGRTRSSSATRRSSSVSSRSKKSRPDAPAGPSSELGAYLDLHYRSFDYVRSRPRDPCHFLDPFRDGDPRELEVAGIVASSLAFGQVKAVLASVRRVISSMGDSPLDFVRRMDPRRIVQQLDGFKHRWTSGKDVAFLLWSLRAVLERHDSLQAVVAGSLEPGVTDITPGLARLAREIATSADPTAVYGKKIAAPPLGFRFLVPSPEAGSTCKRLLMFARWMVRRPDAADRVDFGIWSTIPPAALLLPLDTHTGRMVRYLGLVPARRSLGYAMAREATDALRAFDPEDPVKYDFALAHLGISGACKHERIPSICGACPLDAVCRL